MRRFGDILYACKDATQNIVLVYHTLGQENSGQEVVYKTVCDGNFNPMAEKQYIDLRVSNIVGWRVMMMAHLW